MRWKDEKKNPEACHELNFFWSDDVQSGSSNIKVLPLRFMGEILLSNLDLLQCWLLSDLGISLETFDGGSLEYWDSH